MPTRFPAESEGRPYALLIANQHYSGTASLVTPAADVSALEARLRARGFDTVSLLNLNSAARFLDELDLALQRAERAEATSFTFYYAGHGSASSDGRNWLLPTAIELGPNWPASAVNLGDVIAKVNNLRGIPRVIILDACRKELHRALTGGTRDVTLQGFSMPSSYGPSPDEPRTLVVFSTHAGQLAQDQVSARDLNSPFAAALLDELDGAADGADLWTILTERIAEKVGTATKGPNGAQVPMHAVLFGARRVPIPLSRSAEATPPKTDPLVDRPETTEPQPPVANPKPAGRHSAYRVAAGVMAAAIIATSWFGISRYTEKARLEAARIEELLKRQAEEERERAAILARAQAEQEKREADDRRKAEDDARAAAQKAEEERRAEDSRLAEREELRLKASEAARGAELARARLRSTRARELLMQGETVKAAGLSLAALEATAASTDVALIEGASQTLYRALAALPPPSRILPVAGLPRNDTPIRASDSFSESGNRFALNFDDPVARILDMTTGIITHRLDAEGAVYSQFSPNGSYFALERAGAITFHFLSQPSRSFHWSLAGGEKGKSEQITLSPDDSMFADGSADRALALRATGSGRTIETFRIPARAEAVNFSAKGDLLAAYSRGLGLAVWSTSSLRRLVRAPWQGTSPNIAISDDSRLVAIFDDDGKGFAAYEWRPEDVDGARRLRTGALPQPEDIERGGYFLPNTNLFVGHSVQGEVSVWNLREGRRLVSFQAGKPPFTNWRQSRNGEMIAFLTGDDRLVAWNWRERRKVADVPRTWQQQRDISISSDFSTFTVLERGALTTRAFIAPGPTRLIGAEEDVTNWGVSHDGAVIASASNKETVLWSGRTGQAVRRWPTEKPIDDGNARTIAVSPNGEYLAMAPGSEAGGDITVVTLRGRAETRLFRGKAFPNLMHLWFDKEVPILFEGGYQTFRMWDVNTGKDITAHGIGYMSSDTIRPSITNSNKLTLPAILIGHSGRIAFHNFMSEIRSDELKWIDVVERHRQRAMFGPDTRYAFSFSTDRVVRAWDTTERKQINERRIPENIKSISVSPDGAHVQILTGDSSLQQWNWRNGEIEASKQLSDCADGGFVGPALLCRDTSNSLTRRAVLLDPTTGRAITSFAENSKLIEQGRFLVERQDSATIIHRVHASHLALLEAAKAALAPHSDEVERALREVQ